MTKRKFLCRIDLAIQSNLSALAIAKHLKIGLYLEDQETKYIEDTEKLSEIFVSDLEIEQQADGDLPQEFLVKVRFTFESSEPDYWLQPKVALFFGEGIYEASLKHETEDRYLIETLDYLFFELIEED